MTKATTSVRFRRRRWIFGLLVAVVIACATAKPLAVLAIDGYQRYLSPYKGYCCAHRALYGGLSCSEFGKQAIQAQGLVGGLVLLHHRFEACHQAARTIRSGRYLSTEPLAEECLESDFDRGKREGKETCDYCTGCVKGCFSDL
jgi:putative component of membrane protein insertase Oxa1/YidC/SpoIIIJ protein YidD